MKSNVLVLCDTEEEYAHQMSQYLKAQKEVPWEIHTYTDPERAAEFASAKEVEILVVAERAYTERIRLVDFGKVVLLNESGVIRYEGIRNVNKYQQAQEVYREILNEYMEIATEPLRKLEVRGHTRIIGLFTPIHRCLQTTFALTMGQMLSTRHRTLYLNFEQYAGLGELAADVGYRDLADLIYFLNTDRDRFLLRMQTVVLKKGQMDYVPPAKAGFNLLEVSAEDWVEMLQKISQSGDYDYVILDLSEGVQGIFEILRMCWKIYTLTREDRSAKGKLAQYERLLSMSDYEDVLQKTSQYRIPRIRRIPEEIELLTKGELADYVRRIMQEVVGAESDEEKTASYEQETGR